MFTIKTEHNCSCVSCVYFGCLLRFTFCWCIKRVRSNVTSNTQVFLLKKRRKLSKQIFSFLSIVFCVFSRFIFEQMYTGVCFPSLFCFFAVSMFVISTIPMTMCSYVVVELYFNENMEISLRHVNTKIGLSLNDFSTLKMLSQLHFSKFKSLRFFYFRLGFLC